MIIRRGLGCAILLLAAACSGVLAGAAPASAQEVTFPPEQHPWARFLPGSWKVVRVVSETLDDNGRVANITVTETRTTLVAADAEGYTLRVDVTVEVGGRRFSSLPQTNKHGYHGETPGQPVSSKRIGETQLAIDGRAVNCEVREVVIEADGVKRVSKIHYSSRVAPYQLYRETTIEGGTDDKRATTLVQVVALGLPERVLGELKQSAYVKTTRQQAQGNSVTLEVHCEQVPGGVVSHVASETDAAGKLVRRSTLELLGYGVARPMQQETSMTQRRHHRKAGRRMKDR